MSLDQHAYRILCRLYRLVLLKQWMAPICLSRAASPAPAGPQGTTGLETLEGRLLLSVAPALVEPAKVHLQGDAGADNLYLRAADGVLEYSATGLADSYTADMDAADGVQSLALTSGARISIDLGDGENHLFVDASLNDALTADGAVLTFQGGSESDTLHGPAGEGDWRVTAQNAGTLNGQIHFSGVENLAGDTGANDTFRLAPGAGVSGLVDGGVGGFDSMIVEGSYGDVAYSAAGPHSGTITLDGSSLRYDGLEPTLLGASATLTINGSALADDLVLRLDPDASGNLQVFSNGGTIESPSFPLPSTSLTINGGLGNDTVTVSGVVNMGTTNLSINAESIALGATANLTAGVVTLTASSSTDLTTLDIVALLNAFHAGHVVDVAHLIGDFLMGDVQTQINLTSATVSATSLTMSATTTVTGVTTGLLNSSLGFTIPGFSAAFANVHAKADVNVSGGSITTTAGLSLSAVSSVTTGATATASASNTDTAVDGAFALSVVDSQATAVIGGAATLAVAGAVSVTASNTTSVTTTAD
ncbi:MAG: hypothetical protein NTV86_23740, partial [Planctomycetota bacterium]|nr:hypothetical protein [Planctomycetota bacterium]